MHSWAMKAGQQRAEVLLIGYFGSYAREDWGMGSDLDIFILVESASIPFMTRASEWDVAALPVPTDVCVYTTKEWADLASQAGRFYRKITDEAVWVYRRNDDA